MFDIAFGLQKSTKDAIFDEFVMGKAAQLVADHTYLSPEEFTNALFDYSALLASVTTTLATEVLMTEEQVKDLLSTIRELDSLDELGQDF